MQTLFLFENSDFMTYFSLICIAPRFLKCLISRLIKPVVPALR